MTKAELEALRGKTVVNYSACTFIFARGEIVMIDEYDNIWRLVITANPHPDRNPLIIEIIQRSK